MTIEKARDPNAIGFESEKWKLFLIFSAGSLAYFLTRPKIYYDEVNLYIKKITKQEVTIPLKNVRSFFQNPFTVSKGTATFEIEFTDTTGEMDKIKFIGSYASKRIKDFKATAQKINSRIEIV